MRYIIIVLWLVLGLVYYLLANTYCQFENNNDVNQHTTLDTSAISIETPCPQIGPFGFVRNSAELITNDQWITYKDSLVSQLSKKKKIQIIGLEIDGERKGEDENLGMTRARVISRAMGLTEENLQIYSSNIGKVNYNPDCQFPGARIKLVTVTEKIKEIQDRTLIYFPYNSTNKLNDAEVENYLDALALKVIKTNERIRLTGHTDDNGKPDYNLELGQSRAEVIKNYLLSKDVPDENILTLSRGETLPITENDTEQGRAQNRRTELEIIK